jgi:TonB family protein
MLFAAAAAAPPQAHTPVVTDPDWARKPTYEEVFAHYPRLMTYFGVEGVAYIRCEVTTAGDASGCKVTFESPAGLGFGSAALEMAPLFKFRPKTVDGQPVAGGVVTIPMHFRLDADEPSRASPPPAEPVDPATMALCQRFARSIDSHQFAPGKSNWAEEVAAQIPARSDESGRDGFVRAFEDARAAFAPKTYARRAELCARMFTRSQLEETVRFLESDAGAAMIANLEAMSPEMSKLARENRDGIAALAVKNYCAATPAACPDPAARPHD